MNNHQHHTHYYLSLLLKRIFYSALLSQLFSGSQIHGIYFYGRHNSTQSIVELSIHSNTIAVVSVVVVIIDLSLSQSHHYSV